jgi:hypothetical protein
MSALTSPRPLRVLILGQDPDVLETVLREVEACGLAVQGSIHAESAPQSFHGREFDLVAFGTGLPAHLTQRLRDKYPRQNPQIRFRKTFAPCAARQIVQAAEISRNITARLDPLDAAGFLAAHSLWVWSGPHPRRRGDCGGAWRE